MNARCCPNSRVTNIDEEIMTFTNEQLQFMQLVFSGRNK
jgi:hypothetical protein